MTDGQGEHQDLEAGRRSTGDVAAPEEFAARDQEDSPPNVGREVKGRQQAADGGPAFPDDDEQAQACRFLGRRLEELDRRIQRLEEQRSGGSKAHASGRRDGQLSELRRQRAEVGRLYERLCGGDTEAWESLRQEVQKRVEEMLDTVRDVFP